MKAITYIFQCDFNIIIAGSLKESKAILVLVLRPPTLFFETSVLINSEVSSPFSKFCFLCFAVLKCKTFFYLYVDLRPKPCFRSSMFLSKLVWYAFPAIGIVFGIYPNQIARLAGIFQNLCENLVRQKCYLGNGKRKSETDENLGSQGVRRVKLPKFADLLFLCKKCLCWKQEIEWKGPKF